MSIERLGMNRPTAEPVRAKRSGRPERREASAPAARRFDAAEVRGGRPQPRGDDTEAMLGRLHERGLITNVSRPLREGGDSLARSMEDELTRMHDSIDRPQDIRRVDSDCRVSDAGEQGVRGRYDERTIRMRRDGFPHDKPIRDHPMEGRVYGRPRPQPHRGPEYPRQDNGVFTIKLYSPKEDTGKSLRIGDHTIPLEKDGSILAGFPDGSMRRITIDQDVMDEMVERGEAWMEGDKPACAEGGSMLEPPPTNAQELYAGVARQIFNRQAKEAAEAGVWDAPSGWKAEHPRPAMAKYNISDRSGMWGANRIAGRMLSYAKNVTGNDPSQIEDLKAAMKRGIADVEKAWGGEVPDVTRKTYDAVVKALDDWAAEKRQDGSAKTAPEAAASVQIAAEEQKPEKAKSANTSSGETELHSKGNPALVEQLKADLERRTKQMLDMVRDMLGKQGKNVSDDGIWRTLASGNFQVDAKTRAEAQKNIAEDGYWGVEQTSDRIVQFAIGLAGSSPEMLDKMEAAFEQGYAEAEKKWGGALPSISQQTRTRVHEKFEELRRQNTNGAAAAAQEGDESDEGQ